MIDGAGAAVLTGSQGASVDAPPRSGCPRPEHKARRRLFDSVLPERSAPEPHGHCRDTGSAVLLCEDDEYMDVDPPPTSEGAATISCKSVATTALSIRLTKCPTCVAMCDSLEEMRLTSDEMDVDAGLAESFDLPIGSDCIADLGLAPLTLAELYLPAYQCPLNSTMLEDGVRIQDMPPPTV